MSKSKGNVVDPDDMIEKFGADALRLYVMFVAPPEKEIEWTDAGLEGSFRFLARVWRLVDQLAETIGGEGIPAPGELDAGRRRARAAAQDARDDPPRHARPRSARAPEHRGLRADGARQRALRVLRPDRLPAASAATPDDPDDGRRRSSAPDTIAVREGGGRGAGADALAVHAAHGRGAVGAARPRRRHRRGRLAGVRRGGRAGPTRSSCRCRSTARSAAALTVPADTSEEQLRELALADPQVAKYLEGKTVKKVVVAGGTLVSIVVD